MDREPRLLYPPPLFHRPLHHCHVPQVPSRTLCLFFLPETAQQRHIQRAERQTLLSCLFRQAFWLKWPFQHHRPASFYRPGSFHCYSPLLVGQTFYLTQDKSFESWEFSPFKWGNKGKLKKQHKKMLKKFYGKYNIVRHQNSLSLLYFLSFSIDLKQSYSLHVIHHLYYDSLYCPYHAMPPCPHCPCYYWKHCKCNHVYKKNGISSYCSLLYPMFPSLYHLSLHSSSSQNFPYQPLSFWIESLYFVISYHKVSVLCKCSNERTFQWRNIKFAPPCLQLQSLLDLQYLYLFCILLSFRTTNIFTSYFTDHRCSKNYESLVLSLITSLWLKCYLYKTNIYIEVGLRVKANFDYSID